MSKLRMIPPAALALSLLVLGGCASKADVETLRSDIADLRSLIEPAGAGAATGPPPAGYAKVSTLVNLPEFIPGLGSLYVQPQTLPAGPFLAYDRGGRLASTIYMIPLSDIAAREKFEQLAVGSGAVRDVDVYFNPGHAGVEEPHYHVVLWHVEREAAALE